MIDRWRWDHSPFTYVRGTLTTGQILLDRLELAAADEARKLPFQMARFWPEATTSVPKGGPGRDTCIR